VADLEVAMLVPRLKAAAGVVELHEPYAPLDEASRQQALAAERLGLLPPDAVEVLHPVRLPRQVEGVGGLHLHAVGQLEGLDAGRGTTVSAAFRRVEAVQETQGVEFPALTARRDLVVLQIADRVLQVRDEGAL